MRGFPRAIGTKQDLENLLAQPEYASQGRAKLQELEAGRLAWVDAEVLADGDPGQNGPEHRVVEETVGGKTVRRQQERRLDPGSPWIRLGLGDLNKEEQHEKS